MRAHDTHHVVPDSNYGQYTMIIDLLMGTYRPHPLDEVVSKYEGVAREGAAHYADRPTTRKEKAS